MRAWLALLCCFSAATLHAASNSPKTDGRVSAVSKTDLQLIAAAGKWWLQKMHAENPTEKTNAKLSLIHIVNHDKAEVHIEACSDGWEMEMRLPVRRVQGAWRADNWSDIISLGGC